MNGSHSLWICVYRESIDVGKWEGSEKGTCAWALAHSPVVFTVNKSGGPAGCQLLFLVVYNSIHASPLRTHPTQSFIVNFLLIK